jgi:hypothetical protein
MLKQLFADKLKHIHRRERLYSYYYEEIFKLNSVSHILEGKVLPSVHHLVTVINRLSVPWSYFNPNVPWEYNYRKSYKLGMVGNITKRILGKYTDKELSLQKLIEITTPYKTYWNKFNPYGFIPKRSKVADFFHKEQSTCYWRDIAKFLKVGEAYWGPVEYLWEQRLYILRINENEVLTKNNRGQTREHLLNGV